MVQKSYRYNRTFCVKFRKQRKSVSTATSIFLVREKILRAGMTDVMYVVSENIDSSTRTYIYTEGEIYRRRRRGFPPRSRKSVEWLSFMRFQGDKQSRGEGRGRIRSSCYDPSRNNVARARALPQLPLINAPMTRRIFFPFLRL